MNNVKRKQTSTTRYLGCSGNVLIFSDNTAAQGDKTITKTSIQEELKNSSDTKKEEKLNSPIAV